MSDSSQPLEPSVLQGRRHFRRRIIPATLLFILGGGWILVAAGMYGAALYVHFQYGPIIPLPETPTRNQLALTNANIFQRELELMSGIVAIVSACAWLRGRWRVAWATVALFLLLSGIHGATSSTL